MNILLLRTIRSPFAIRTRHLLLFLAATVLLTSTAYPQSDTWRPQNDGLVGKSIYSFWLCNSGTILAGSSNGDIFRSTDDGESWSRVRRGRVAIELLNPDLNKVQAFAQSVNGMILAGTNQGELASSTNNGLTWNEVPTSPFTSDIRDIQFGPRDEIYLATFNHGLLRRTSGNSDWEAIDMRLNNQRALSMVMSAGNLFVGTQQNGVMRSTDSGSSWKVIRNGLVNLGNECWPILDLATNSFDELVAVTGLHVFYLRKGDTTWFENKNNPDYFESLTRMGTNILALGKFPPPATFGEADDVTHGWRPIPTAGMNTNCVRRAATYTSRGFILVGVEAEGIYRTTDKGRSWKQVNNGLTNGYMLSLFCAQQSREVYAGTYFGGVYKSTDNGATWKNAGLRTRPILAVAANAQYIFAATTPNPHAAIKKPELLRSDDGGQSWSAFSPDFGSVLPTSIAVGKLNRVFLGTNGRGVYFSTNNGENWESRNEGLSDPVVNAIQLSGDGTVWIATPSGVSQSSDNGKTWKATGLQDVVCLALAADKHNRLFVGTEEKGLYLGDPRKGTWKKANLSLATVRILSVDSTGSVIAGDGNQRLYRSTDAGDSWFVFNREIPPSVSISGVTATSDGFIMATVGEGVFSNGAIPKPADRPITEAQGADSARARQLRKPPDRVTPFRYRNPDSSSSPNRITRHLGTVNKVERTGPEFIARSGHLDQIQAAAFSPDDRWIATSSSDLTFRIWEVATGKLIRSFVADDYECRSLAFTPDGKALWGGGRQSLWMMDIVNGSMTRRSSEHGFVTAMAVSPDGSALVTGHLGGTILLWNPKTIRSAKTLDYTSSSGQEIKSICFLDSSTILRINEKGIVGIMDIVSGMTPANLVGAPQSGHGVYRTRSGKILLASSRGGNILDIWDMESARIVQSFMGVNDDVLRVGFAADGNIVLTAERDNSLKVWSTADGSLLQRIDLGGWGACIATSHGGLDVVTTVGKALRFWKLKWPRKSPSGPVMVESVCLPGAPARIMSLDFKSSDRSVVMARSDGRISVLQISNRPKLTTWQSDTIPVMSIASNPTKPMLATINWNFSVSLWHSQTGAKTRTLTGPSLKHESRPRTDGIAISPDGRMLASIQPDANVKLWDIEKERSIANLVGHALETEAVAFSHDNTLLATGGYDGSVMIWSTKDGKRIRILQRHKLGLRALTFAPRGDLLASAGSFDWSDEIKIWNVETGREARSLGRNFPAVRSLLSYLDGNTEMLATGHYDGSIRIWNMETGELLSLIPGHASGVDGLAIWQKGCILISGSEDGSVKLWNSRSGTELASISLIDDHDWVATTPNGNFDCSNGGFQHVYYVENGVLGVNIRSKESFRRPGLLNVIFDRTPNDKR